MARWCVVKKCPNKVKGKIREGVTLHKFPRTPDLLQKWEEWVNSVNRLCNPSIGVKKFKAYASALLCCYHFEPSCFKFGQLKRDSVPSIPSADSVVGNTYEILQEVTISKTFKPSHDTASVFEPTIIISTDDPINQLESSIKDTETKDNKDDSTADRTPKQLRRKHYVDDLTEEDFPLQHEILQKHCRNIAIMQNIANIAEIL